MNFLSKIKKHFGLKTLIGVVLGGAGGFAYYYFIGCQSGSCPITSNPLSSIFYGTVIGLVWTIK